jgi:hypothetical protein
MYELTGEANWLKAARSHADAFPKSALLGVNANDKADFTNA